MADLRADPREAGHQERAAARRPGGVPAAAQAGVRGPTRRRSARPIRCRWSGSTTTTTPCRSSMPIAS